MQSDSEVKHAFLWFLVLVYKNMGDGDNEISFGGHLGAEKMAGMGVSMVRGTEHDWGSNPTTSTHH